MSIVGSVIGSLVESSIIDGAGAPALPWEPGRGGGIAPIEQQIIAAYTAVGWTVGGLFLARLSDVTLVSTKVSVWANLGTGADALQGTDATRPVWNASGLGTGASLTFAGAQSMLASALASGSATAYALSVLFTDSDTANKFVAGFGAIGDECILLDVNAGAAGDLDIYADGLAGAGSLTSRARSAASYPMTSPAVVTGTWDSALATNETEIRHAGVNATSTRPNNSNNTDGVGTQNLTVGARAGGGNMAGEIAALVLAWGTTAIPTAALGTVEALLAAEWGV